MVAYLGFADRTYGRIAAGSLARYRRQRRVQLTIGEVRQGSMLLVIREAANAVFSAHGLILTGLALKYLPDLVRAPATSYRDYQEGRLIRAKRERLAHRVASDKLLRELTRKDLSQILGVLTKIYEVELGGTTGAQKFARNSIEDVRINERDE